MDDRRKKEIESLARRAQVWMWKDRDQFLRREDRNKPLKVLDPAVALERMCGYKLISVADLGTTNVSGNKLKAAGQLDRQSHEVHICWELPKKERDFTLAHELAHIVLGHHGKRIHRDRPATSGSWQRPWQEIEADYFAACFLMPEKQVREVFESHFGTDRFVLDESTAFGLSKKTLHEVLRHCRSRRDLCHLLAKSECYGTKMMNSMAAIFSVTSSAMAIRLEELKLVSDPYYSRLSA